MSLIHGTLLLFFSIAMEYLDIEAKFLDTSTKCLVVGTRSLVWAQLEYLAQGIFTNIKDFVTASAQSFDPFSYP